MMTAAQIEEIYDWAFKLMQETNNFKGVLEPYRRVMEYQDRTARDMAQIYVIARRIAKRMERLSA
jgi:hypothetical protein